MVKKLASAGVSLPDIGAVAVMLAGFLIIGFGKQTETITVVVGAAAGYLFGTHTNKPRR